MINNEIDRRRFLQIVVAVLSTGATGTSFPQSPEPTRIYDENDPDLEFLRIMGAQYISDFPDDSSGRNEILSLLSDANLSVEEVIDQLQTLVRQDYAMDRVTNLSGWILSLTEARVMAAI